MNAILSIFSTAKDAAVDEWPMLLLIGGSPLVIWAALHYIEARHRLGRNMKRGNDSGAGGKDQRACSDGEMPEACAAADIAGLAARLKDSSRPAVLTSRGKIIYLNPAASRFLDIAAEELIGQRVGDRFHFQADDAGRPAARSEGRSRQGPAVYRRSDGTLIGLEALVVSLEVGSEDCDAIFLADPVD